MNFTWDPKKNRTNKRDHGVSFEEAQTLFDSGEDYVDLPDDAHSDEEFRSKAIGPIVAKGLILVVYTERHGDTIHLISARKADAREAGLYHAYMEGKSQ